VSVPSLALAAALDLEPKIEVGERVVRTSGAEQRLSEDGTFLASFRGPNDSYPQVRPSMLLQAGSEWHDARDAGQPYAGPKNAPNAQRDYLKGRIVVWGVNIPGLKDVVATPISDQFNGPEFQATVLDDLLHGDGRVLAPTWVNVAILFALCAIVGAVAGFASVRGLALGTTVLLGVAVVFVGYRLFERGTAIDLFVPSVGLLFAYAGTTAFRLMTEGRRNRWLESTFSQYLSPAVIERLKADPSMLALGGRLVEITVFFSDVKGFTTLSEALSSEDLVRLLNRYLTSQSRQVLDQDGVIDKFIGDAVMAFFGDPVPTKDHAVRACRAAVRCRQAIADVEPLCKELGIPPVLNRIGVNTGPAKVGNMGSEDRFDYTAMGDSVNLASRLEGANKAFGSWILLGPRTYELAKDDVLAKPIARLRVVGKKEAVPVYELLAMRDTAPAGVEARSRARRSG
jgi:adenylate cyclase